MKYLMTFFVLTSGLVQAEVSKQNVDEMLKQMVNKEVISESQAASARARLAAMDHEQWNKIKAQAHKVAERSPASVPHANEKQDLHSAQFEQIENEIKRILPENNRD